MGQYYEATNDVLLLFSEIDPALHATAAPATPLTYKPKYFLINGKTSSSGKPLVVATGGAAVVASAVLSLIALFGVGAGMSYLTGRSFVVSGLRMMAIGGAAATITFGVGKLLNVTTGI